MAERNAIAVLIKLLGGEAMTEELKKLGETGEKAMEQIQDAAKKVEFGGLGNDLSILIGDIGNFAKRSVIALGLLKVAADGVGAALLLLAKSGAEAADEAGKAAQAAGISAKSYQEWAFAAESVGVSQKQMSTALNTFNKQVNKTANETAASGKKIGGAFDQAGSEIIKGIGSTTQVFKDINVEVTRFGDNAKASGDKAKAGATKMKTGFDDLGISVRNAAGNLKTNDQLLAEVANAFQKLPDGAVKSAIAIKLFGLEGAKLIPLLDQGAAGIDEFKAKAAELGIVFTDEQIQQAAKFNDALNELKQAAGGVLRQLGLIFVPSFTAGFNAFRDIILRNKAAVLDFANNALAKAKVLVADFFAALSGRDADVNNRWIIEWRDAIVGFGEDALHVVNGVVLPAFKLLREGAGLVTDAINKMFGTNVSGGELLILASITQVLGGFRLIKDAIFVAINAISIFSSALVANPWLLAITAVAGGIAVWATRTDEATIALQRHKEVVDEVDAAYQKVGGELAKMTQEVRDRLTLETSDALTKDVAAFNSALADLTNKLPHFEGDLGNAAANQMFAIAKALQEGKISVEEFNKEISRIGAENVGNDVGKLASSWLAMSKDTTEASGKVQEMGDKFAWVTGKMSDAQFAAAQAARGIAGYGAAAKRAGDDAEAGLNKTGAAADQTAGKVGELGHQITVIRGGGSSLSKEVFDVVDGVARRADQSKQALDGVASSAEKAQGNVKNVSNEITNSIDGAVKPDAAKAGVDGIVGDINTIAPAAQQAATGVSDALGNIDPSGAAAAAAAFAAPFTGLPAQISTIMSGIQSLVTSGFANLASTVSSLAAQIRNEIASIISALQAAVAQAQSLRAQASSSGGGGSQGSFAEGGHVVGAGTGTSDSILAWLSNGEFVMRAAAVRRLGVGFLNALNNGFIPSLKNLRGFNMGGLARRFSHSMAIPRMAAGGLAASVAAAAAQAPTTPIHLHFDGGQEVVFDAVGLSDHAMQTLQTKSLRSARVSAGRAPRRGT